MIRLNSLTMVIYSNLIKFRATIKYILYGALYGFYKMPDLGIEQMSVESVNNLIRCFGKRNMAVKVF